MTTLSSWNHLAGVASVDLSFYHHLVFKTLASQHTSEIFCHLNNVHTLLRTCWALKLTVAHTVCFFILLLRLLSAIHTKRTIRTLKCYGHALHGYDTNSLQLHCIWTKTKRYHKIHPPIIHLLKWQTHLKFKTQPTAFWYKWRNTARRRQVFRRVAIMNESLFRPQLRTVP